MFIDKVDEAGQSDTDDRQKKGCEWYEYATDNNYSGNDLVGIVAGSMRGGKDSTEAEAR